MTSQLTSPIAINALWVSLIILRWALQTEVRRLSSLIASTHLLHIWQPKSDRIDFLHSIEQWSPKIFEKKHEKSSMKNYSGKKCHRNFRVLIKKSPVSGMVILTAQRDKHWWREIFGWLPMKWIFEEISSSPNYWLWCPIHAYLEPSQTVLEGEDHVAHLLFYVSGILLLIFWYAMKHFRDGKHFPTPYFWSPLTFVPIHSTEMIVYRDIISEDEVLSDAFKLSPVVDKDGATVSLHRINDDHHHLISSYKSVRSQ